MVQINQVMPHNLTDCVASLCEHGSHYTANSTCILKSFDELAVSQSQCLQRFIFSSNAETGHCSHNGHHLEARSPSLSCNYAFSQSCAADLLGLFCTAVSRIYTK